MTDYRYSRVSSPGRAYDSDSYTTEDPFSRSRGITDPFQKHGSTGDPYTNMRGMDEPQYASRSDPYSKKSGPYPLRQPNDSMGFQFIEDDPYNRRPPPVELRNNQFKSDSYSSAITPPHSDYPDALYGVPMKRESTYGSLMPTASITYELDHLATFTISQKQSLVNADDGMRELRKMENSTGVWTMRVELRISSKEIVVTELKTRKEIECFHISRIQDPVHIRSDNPKDVYNNILIFTVSADGTARMPPEMNVFQCIGIPAQEIAEDINAARTGKFPRRPAPPQVKEKVSPRAEPPPTSQYDQIRRPGRTSPPYVPRQKDPVLVSAPVAAVHSKDGNTEQEVNQLNKCIDDIERFVASLQQAANARNELDRLESSGGPKSDFLTQRATPPATKEFVNVLQKFKFAFNLLPKLKHLLKDPNAEELSRMLWSPLVLVLEACRDPNTKEPKLANSVVSPLLTMDACKLLDRCLIKTDVDLWQSLGEAWVCPSEDWRGAPAAPYTPIFDSEKKSNGTDSRYEQSPTDTVVMTNGNGSINSDPAGDVTNNNQQAFLNELRARNCKICQVQAGRTGQNSKELNLVTGEYLQVTSDDKNWWKVCNIRNESGYAPKTILKPLYGFA